MRTFLLSAALLATLALAACKDPGSIPVGAAPPSNQNAPTLFKPLP